jgi:hypothetical protein
MTNTDHTADTLSRELARRAAEHEAAQPPQPRGPHIARLVPIIETATNRHAIFETGTPRVAELLGDGWRHATQGEIDQHGAPDRAAATANEMAAREAEIAQIAENERLRLKAKRGL